VAPQTGRFQPVDRLRRSVEFQQVMRRGHRAAGRAFVVVCAPRAERAPAGRQVRLGITVSRKVGNAVVRNRVKRRVREWFRAERASLAASVDVVVIGRAPAAALAFTDFANELSDLSSAALRGMRRPGAA
jgi:ribonuclease P protein component